MNDHDCAAHPAVQHCAQCGDLWGPDRLSDDSLCGRCDYHWQISQENRRAIDAGIC